MTTPETRSVGLEQPAPSFDERAVENEENQGSETDTRELPAYRFDSDDETLVGIGNSGSADSISVRHFDSSDRTLVGIGSLERAKLAELAEAASQSQQAEPTPQSVPMPHSEPPGPFVAADDDDIDDETALRLPLKKGGPWLLALPAVLVAAAAVAVVRGVVPHSTAPRLHPASIVAPPPVANKPRTSYARFETAAAISAEAPAVEVAITPATPATPAPEVPEPMASAATALREKPPELAQRHVTAKLAGAEPLGALDVTSNPPSSLVLDGRPLGKTPRVVQLSSGPHTVVFVHPERGRMSLTVNVRAGRTTSASADF